MESGNYILHVGEVNILSPSFLSYECVLSSSSSFLSSSSSSGLDDALRVGGRVDGLASP
jgi:hypothetical protein